MPRIPKTYEYKIYRGTTYLGLLPYVTSEFSYSQSINSSGSQLNIIVGESPDTARYAVQALTDEGGNEITTEDGETITTEREDDLVGSGSDDALIQNDNLVKVYEVSENHPNGLLVFSGYISMWRALFGGADSVEITVLSDGQDLNQWVIPGGDAYSIDISQTVQDSYLIVNSGSSYGGGQTFTPSAGVENIAAIMVRIQSVNAAVPQTITVKLWEQIVNVQNPTNLLATSSQVFQNGAETNVIFYFPTPVTVDPSNQYFFDVTTSDNVNGFNIMLTDTDTIPGSNSYFYVGTPPSGWYLAAADAELYFKTYEFDDSIERLYVNRDPSYILNDIFEEYGGAVTPNEVFPNTGITVPEYTFKLNTVLEGLRAVGGMSPSDWYWFVDPTDNTLYFQQASAEPDIVLIKGRHINYLSIEGTKETVVTKAYFSGGDDGTGDNVFVVVTDTSTDNRLGIVRLSDNNVNGTDGNATATILAQNYIDRNNVEIYRTSVTVDDSTMDTNLFKIGMMIGFTGCGTFVDRLMLQVVGIEKRPDNVTLQLGSLQPRASQIVDSIQYSITSVQTSNNPNIPS